MHCKMAGALFFDYLIMPYCDFSAPSICCNPQTLKSARSPPCFFCIFFPVAEKVLQDYDYFFVNVGITTKVAVVLLHGKNYCFTIFLHA